jgi:Family of unknown function (DUF6467)
VALAIVESSLKYQPDLFAALTLARDPGRGPCMVGSLTGAVSSKRVTEEYEGTLTTVGNRGSMCIGKSVLDCETDKSSRCESRSK